MLRNRLLKAACALLLTLTTPLYADTATDTLSELEIADLVFMRQEEKLARDVYAELYSHYKEDGMELLILANITASEQRHMDAMLGLLERYGLEDPVDQLGAGEFEHPVLATLYTNLTSDNESNATVLDEPSSGGRVSPQAALYVGAWIEERDMIDILHAIDNTSRAEIVGVYSSLLCGSREHLRAFVKQLGTEDYRPQLLASTATADPATPPEQTLEYWLGDESDAFCV